MSELSGTLSTDAIVARDAFRGMMETLSNSENHIRRATRLAFYCAKNRMANEVNIVDLIFPDWPLIIWNLSLSNILSLLDCPLLCDYKS